MPVAVSRTRRARSSGQSLVELALIAPVFLILLMTAIDLGRLMYSQITITNAAKEAVLVASQGGTWKANQPCSDTNTVMCGAISEAKDGFVIVEQTRVTLTPKTCEANATYPPGGPPTVSVEVNSPFQLLTPIIGSIVGSNIVLHSTAKAECLAVPAVTFPSIPAPIAAFTASQTSVTVGQTVNFDASSSSSPGATITGYGWNFGGSGVLASQTYNSAGSFTVVLTVTDSRGQTDTASTTITVTGGGPTATPPPSCPTLSFTSSANANTQHPHGVDLTGSVSDGSKPKEWDWSWSGAITAKGDSLKRVDFPGTGTFSVTLTATKGSCVLTKTQPVTAP